MKIFTFEVWHVHPDGGRASDRRDYNVIHETAAQAEATLRPGFGSAWRIALVREMEIAAGTVLPGEGT